MLQLLLYCLQEQMAKPTNRLIAQEKGKSPKWPLVKITEENDVQKLLREVFCTINHSKEKVWAPTIFVQLNDKCWGISPIFIQ